MTALSRFVSPRSILVLIILACVMVASTWAPATDRPADTAGVDRGEVEQFAAQHQSRLDVPPGWFHHRHRRFPLFRDHTDLIVGHYTLVSSRRLTHAVTEFTYRARLTNAAPPSGLAALEATAQAISLSPAIQIVEGKLTFGDVPAGASATSVDTFTIHQHHGFVLEPHLLRWRVSADRELAVPSSWVGTWHITLTYRNPATNAVTAVEETDGVIRPDEPLGIAFGGPLATCAGRMTDKALTLGCELRALPTAPCHVKGTLDLTVTRVADAIGGSGAWQASGPECKPALSVGQTLAVSGIRLSRDPGPAPDVASTLLRRFVSQPLFVLFASGN